MGLILMNITPMNAAMNSRQLTMNCHQSVVGVEKLSAVHNNKVAAASSPTTAGRRPWKTLSTLWWYMYFMNILLMRIIRINEGSTSAKVATAYPNTPMGAEYPALTTDV